MPQVGDEPGVVTDWTLRRAPADGETEPLFWPASRDGRPGPSAARRPHARAPRGSVETAAGRRGPAGAEADPDRLFWQQRALAAACAAGAAAWIGAHVLTPAPMPLLLLGLLAASVTLLLPRLGWLATVAFACATTAIQGHDGLALVLAIAAAVPIVTMPVSPTAWPLAAGAPALGLVGPAGLAGAWPALAGLARTPWRRAALAVSGWLWLLAAGAVGALHGRFRHGLYVPKPRGPGRGTWSDSLGETVHHLFPVVCPYRRAARRGRVGAGGAARAVSGPRPLGDRRCRPGAALVGPHGRGDGGRDHDHRERWDSGTIKQRLPTTSAEIVGASRARWSCCCGRSSGSGSRPALRGSTDEAP